MAELNIRERQAGDVTVLDLDGKITANEGAVALRKSVRHLGEERKKKILFNLGGVGFIDSTGLGELVHAVGQEFCAKCGCEYGEYSCPLGHVGETFRLSVKLANVTQQIQNLLVITRLINVFDLYESESNALGSFE